MPMWLARSSYVPIRKMYNTVSPEGRPRPVLDLEPHYENTHHFFSVSSEVSGWRLMSSLMHLSGAAGTYDLVHGRRYVNLCVALIVWLIRRFLPGKL